jgi:hypothetical protein
MDFVSSVYIPIPANALKCSKLLLKSAGGKNIVRIQIQFEVININTAKEIRSFENRILDSLPFEKDLILVTFYFTT